MIVLEFREALEYAMSVKRISWPIMLSDGSSESNSTDYDAALKRAGPSNVTITSNRDLNVSKCTVIFANI